MMPGHLTEMPGADHSPRDTLAAVANHRGTCCSWSPQELMMLPAPQHRSQNTGKMGRLLFWNSESLLVSEVFL